MATTLEYQLRIRDAGDTTDVLTITSVRGGTAPYLAEPPSGDGCEFDPLSGAYRSGSMTCRVIDAITSGTSRLVTSQLEDADFRQQLAGRPAYVEERENGGSWETVQAGIVTGIRLPSALIYEIDVGDAMRATRNLVAFTPRRDPGDATKVEPFADFLARWPVRGCLAGGPVRGGFLGVPDLGGWEFVVERDTDVFGTVPIKYLRFISGYQSPEFKRTGNAAEVKDALNKVIGAPSSANRSARSAFPDEFEGSGWTELVVQVGSDYFAAGDIIQAAYSGYFGSKDFDPGFMIVNRGASGIFVIDPDDVLSTSGTIKRVRVFDMLPSERCPIYYSGHPLELWTKLCDEAGLTYDAAAVSAVTDALGSQRRINLRITEPMPLASFFESVLYGPCGFSVRTNGNGELVPFTTRVRDNSSPSITITSADVPQEEAPLFELSEADAITKVTFNQINLTPATAADAGIIGTDVPADGVIAQPVLVERTYSDASAPVQREQSYSIPGFLDGGSGSYEPQLVDAMALEIFDRFGRGPVSGEFTALRGGAGDGVVEGDELILALPSMPNQNKRLGDDGAIPGRVVQIVRMTRGPRGKRVRFLDSGPNGQTVLTLPTLSLVAGTSPGDALLTITNAATLNAVPIGVRIQWAQSSGGAPSASDYVDLDAYAPGTIPTGAIPLHAGTIGTTIYVRARSEQAAKRPSNYSSAVSLATTAYGAPGSLSATPNVSDGSLCALSWTTGTGASAAPVEVYVRLTADPASADVRRAVLLPGSVTYTLEGLTPGTAYTASVRHYDAASGNYSSKSTVGFTAGATTVTLSPPTSPTGFCGSRDPVTGSLIRDHTYGIAVAAASHPGAIEVAEAIETAVGAGTYGSFVTSAKIVPNVLGDWTAWQASAPNDGKRRQLKVRHIRDGATPSAYTTPIEVLPWTPLALPPFPSTAFFECFTSESGSQGTVTVVVTDPLRTIDPTDRIDFTKLELGLRTTGLSPSTAPSAGVTEGTYTYTFDLNEKHPITIGILAHYRDGTDEKIREFTFDFDKLANCKIAIVDTDESTATVTVTADTDTGTGSNAGEYSLDGGPWVDFDVDAVTYVGAFDVAKNTATQALRVRVKDADGNPGPIVEGTIGVSGSVSYGIPAVELVLTAEATAADDVAGYGMVHALLTFSRDIDHFLVYTAEDAAAGVAAPRYDNASLSATIRRLEGDIESDDDWVMMHDIATTASYYRKVYVIAVGPTGLRSDPWIEELQAVDTGTAPTAPPSSFSVSMPGGGSTATASLTWTNGDASAQTRIRRNGVVVAIVAAGVASFDDDGLTPTSEYQYVIDHYRNGQTSASASDTASTSTPTLAVPTWASGYPQGFLGGSGGRFKVGISVVNPDPLAETLVYMDADGTDTGPYTLEATIPAGGTSVTLGKPLPEDHYFYLVSRRSGFGDSADSSHEFATFGG